MGNIGCLLLFQKLRPQLKFFAKLFSFTKHLKDHLHLFLKPAQSPEVRFIPLTIYSWINLLYLII